MLSAADLIERAKSNPIVSAEWLDKNKFPVFGPPESWVFMSIEFEGIPGPEIISQETVRSIGSETWLSLWRGAGDQTVSDDEKGDPKPSAFITGCRLDHDDPSCPSCDFIDWEPLGVKGGLHWARCRRCGENVTSPAHVNGHLIERN